MQQNILNTEKTVIFGAKGQLGRELAVLLPRAQIFNRSSFDITDKQKIDAFPWEGVAFVLNAAAYTNVDEAESLAGSRQAWLTNTQAVDYLVRAAQKCGAVYAHVSTDYVFDGTNPTSYKETDIHTPINTYGKTKAAGDMLAASYVRHYIFRTSWVVGQGKNFVNTMRALADTQSEVKVVADQVGSPTFAADLARAIIEVIARQAPFGTYNVTNTGGAISWAEFARTIFKILGKNVYVREITTQEYLTAKPQAAMRPKNSTLDLTKLGALGIELQNWQTALTVYLISKHNEAGLGLHKSFGMPSVSAGKKMKGIILSGGMGTRLSPLTRVTSKQLLPVYNKPLIAYPLEVLRRAGITDILIIVAPDHCGDYMKFLGSGKEFGCKFTYEIQDEARGLAEAFLIGEEFIDSDNVALILGDNIFEYDFSNTISEFTSGGLIFAKQVPDPERFGVVEFDQFGKALRIVEKPQQFISPYAIPGLYVYDNRVIEAAKQVKPSSRGELEITDIHNWYLERGELQVKIIDGEWIDAGTFESLFKASEFIRMKQQKSL